MIPLWLVLDPNLPAKKKGGSSYAFIMGLFQDFFLQNLEANLAEKIQGMAVLKSPPHTQMPDSIM